MSVYHVNLLCRRLVLDPIFRAVMQSDPVSAMADMELTEQERSAILSGDVAQLFRGGANAFLLGHLCRFGICGLDVPSYNERMRAVKVDEVGRPLP